MGGYCKVASERNRAPKAGFEHNGLVTGDPSQTGQSVERYSVLTGDGTVAALGWGCSVLLNWLFPRSFLFRETKHNSLFFFTILGLSDKSFCLPDMRSGFRILAVNVCFNYKIRQGE